MARLSRFMEIVDLTRETFEQLLEPTEDGTKETYGDFLDRMARKLESARSDTLKEIKPHDVTRLLGIPGRKCALRISQKQRQRTDADFAIRDAVDRCPPNGREVHPGKIPDEFTL